MKNVNFMAGTLLALMAWCSGVLPSLAAEAADSGIQRIKITDERLVVNGLPWFKEDKPLLSRLPVRLKGTFRDIVWGLAQQPSGARIRFRTNSRWVNIQGKVHPTRMDHMPLTGSSGIDLYVNGRYAATSIPDKEKPEKLINLAGGTHWRTGRDREMRDITIYLPLYSIASVEEVWLETDATLEAPSAFAVSKPVVYYGSSITQGGCAANPGLSYQAIVSRWLNVDFVNLGFSGNGIGDTAVARAMAEIDCSCVVLDYWANPGVGVLKSTLGPFVDILRKKFPDVPIIVIGPYYEPLDEISPGEFEGKRQVEIEFVARRRKDGDSSITFVDGLEMISKDTAYGLVDGRHCNSIGFYLFAKALEPNLRKALKLEETKK